MSLETISSVGHVEFRPIRPDDRAALVRYFEAITPEDIRMRFFGPMRALSTKQLNRMTNVDPRRELAYVVVDHVTSDLLSIGRLAFEPGTERAEFAISVRSDMKGRGIGRFVMERIIAAARERGIAEIFGDILEENTTMLAFAKQLGFALTNVPESAAIVRATYKL